MEQMIRQVSNYNPWSIITNLETFRVRRLERRSLWPSKKQAHLALESTENEYIAQAHAMQELLWLQLLVSEININQQYPINLALSYPLSTMEAQPS